MPHVDLLVRQKVAGLVEKLMADYEDQIEDAYCQVEEGEFAVSFKAKLKPKGDSIVVKVEQSFDPQKKVKDTISETINKNQRPLPFNESERTEQNGLE